MFRKILVANRGEIAVRIFRTLKKMGIASVAVYSEMDRNAPHTKIADEAVCLGGKTPAESYLCQDKILEIAQQMQVDAIHPGYGFLAENATFATRCLEAKICFIGPSPEAIRLMGSKVEARKRVQQYQVPVVPGYEGEEQTVSVLIQKAKEIGFPVLIKASAGGGGKGMRVCHKESELEPALEASRREALNAFGDGTLFLEKYLEAPRHIEFQILADLHGHCVHLFERECSIQRRHQKIIEEAPAPGMTADLREKMGNAAILAAKSVQYTNAGTIEFLLTTTGDFYFLEMNTRIQVEHPVTEAITGLDLVEQQILVELGKPLSFQQKDLHIHGHALECRLYAENPEKDFLPTTGTLHDWFVPDIASLRVDAGVEYGSEISIYYDPLLAKIITQGSNRPQAIQKMVLALQQISALGCVTNQSFLLQLLQHSQFQVGHLHTHFIAHYFPQISTQVSEDVLEVNLCAATFFRFHQRLQTQTLLPQVVPGYRNNRYRLAEEKFRFGEQEYIVFYESKNPNALNISFQNKSISVVLIEKTAPCFRLEIQGIQRNFRIIEFADTLAIHSLLGKVTLTLVSRFPSSRTEEKQNFCLAPMTGKVLKILAQPNALIEKGQSLLILEAMKMEHTLRSSEEGLLKTIYVQLGEVVERGTRLFDFEPVL